MKEAYAYHGHSIDLDLEEIGQLRFQWTYFIDADYCVQDKTDALSIAAAGVDALALAHGSVDALDAIRRPGRPGRDADAPDDARAASPTLLLPFGARLT